MTPNEKAGKHTGTCPATGKRMYQTRRSARLAARRAHPGVRLSSYRCEHCSMWHYGNLNPSIRAGQAARPTQAGAR